MSGGDEADEDVQKKSLAFSPINSENKSCSACPEDQHKHLTYMSYYIKQSLLSIDMKTKVVHLPCEM